MRDMKRLMFILLSMLLLGGCGKLTNEKTMFVNDNVVFVQNGSIQGSGVIYQKFADHVIVVTAAHVVSNDQNVMVQHKKADRIHLVDGLDLVFLVLDGVDLSVEVDPVGKKEGTPVTETESDNRLCLKGYDASGTRREINGIQTEKWIYVEDFGCHMMIGKADATPGMSGGGVFDQNNDFLGIICGMDQEGNVAILPAAVIRSEYEVLFGDQSEK